LAHCGQGQRPESNSYLTIASSKLQRYPQFSEKKSVNQQIIQQVLVAVLFGLAEGVAGNVSATPATIPLPGAAMLRQVHVAVSI
jgi:hypothetical protein